METQPITISRTALRYGLFTAASLAAYEVFASQVDLGIFSSPEILNLLVLIIGIMAAIRFYTRHIAHMRYQDGMGLGILTGLFSTLFYALFVFIYYTFIDPSYLETSMTYPRASLPNGLGLAAVTVIEGISFGVIITFVAVQFFMLNDKTEVS